MKFDIVLRTLREINTRGGLICNPRLLRICLLMLKYMWANTSLILRGGQLFCLFTYFDDLQKKDLLIGIDEVKRITLLDYSLNKI